MRLWDWFRHALLGDLRLTGECAKCGYENPIVDAAYFEGEKWAALYCEHCGQRYVIADHQGWRR